MLYVLHNRIVSLAINCYLCVYLSRGSGLLAVGGQVRVDVELTVLGLVVVLCVSALFLMFQVLKANNLLLDHCAQLLELEL